MPTKQKRRSAVEASPSRVKKLGYTSNLYIVEGEPHAYAATQRHREGIDDEEYEGFDISTRSIDHPTRVGYLVKTEYTIETLWPRPNVGPDWSQAEDGLWYKAEE